ncbi:hypothetical protein BJY01DRAFT_247361 [Aspergillus pseudoustus]|uniref:Uncharacterized protein n=1 Tax=Aspergillus pseudoustus TaxID=1810923 RepID=A0ABR4K1H9_9EURO
MADTITVVSADPSGAPQAQSETRATGGPVHGPKRKLIRFLDPRNIVGFLWLGPALALLILNFRNHIIGSGLNCRSHCRIDPYSTGQVEQIERLDGTNRDVLGALQFVAKGLEVWFMYVAASFIYILAVNLSAKDDRLPVSLLLVYAEFMDLLYLKDLAMRIREFVKERRQRTTTPDTTPPSIHSGILYAFVVLVAFLCIVANLMGVATATLVIPGLQYIDINMNDSVAFNEMLSADPPTGSFIRGCEPGDLSSGSYACTANLYASSLDQLVESAVATERQQAAYSALLLPPVSQENDLSLSANVSDDAGILWAPSRQVSREFSDDLQNYYTTTQWINNSNPDYNAYPDSRRFNQSLQTQLQRAGPTIGLTGDCWSYTGAQVFRLADDRSVRCYGGLFVNPGTTVTKCIRWGAGWDDANAASSASFTIPDIANEFDINATVYTTPSARYLRDTSCLDNESCDWNRIFADPAESDFVSISDSQQTYEYNSDFGNRMVWCDNTGFLSFATYAVDPSPVSNLLHLAQLGVLRDRPDTDTEQNRDRAATMTLHADWTLAAWSVNATDSVVDGTRGSSTSFVTAYQRFVGDPAVGNTRFNLIQTYITMQAASLIPYTTQPLSTSSDRRLQREREGNNPYTAATLQSWATVQLWKYGVDSRTKRLGVVILIVGVVIVIATTVLWIESPQSPTRVVLAALFHERPVGLQEKDEETGRPLFVSYKSGNKKLARASTFAFQSRQSAPLEASGAPTGNGIAAGKAGEEDITVQETGKI